MKNNHSLSKKNFFSENLPAILIFLWMPLYGFVVVCRCQPALVDDVTYLFHCVDFSMGFCSKFLPGAVYNLFVKEPSQFSATVYEYILLFIFYAALSIMLQKWLKTLPDEYHTTGIQILALYLTGSCTFAAYIYQPGMLDVGWIYLSVIFILCAQNRYTRFLLPLLMIPANMIHYGVMLTYVPFWALILLYEIVIATDKKEKRIWTALFFASCAVAVAVFVYFFLFDKKNTVYDINTFNEIIKNRGSNDYAYFDYALYFSSDNLNDFSNASGYILNENLPVLFSSTTSPVLNFFYGLHNQVNIQLYFILRELFTQILFAAVAIILVMLPLLWMFYGFICNRFKQSKGNKAAVFLYFCVGAIIPFSSFGSLFFSSDSSRWLNHGVLCCFTLILYIIYREQGTPIAYFRDRLARFSPTFFSLWRLLYCILIFDPYV